MMKRNRPPIQPIKKNLPQGLKFYGFHACLKLWEARPDDVLRVYVEQRNVKDVSALLKWCAGKNKPYHIISPEEMAKVTDSVHHEGLCILAKEPPLMSFSEMLKAVELNKGPECSLYFDGVQNPHNIGSIMRVCAHFGVKYILGEKSQLPSISPSAYRIAQGGAEYVQLVQLDRVQPSLQMLEQKGFRLIASSSHGGQSLYGYKFSQKTLLIMGSESEGINPKLMSLAKDRLLIPGTGLVESLNVSVATGLFLGEFWRQTGPEK